ncbi:MAG: inositol monophosphatase family protein [Anaerolineae bacterium]
MLDVAIRAVREVGEILLDGLGDPHDIRVKGVRDIATEVDLRAERTAIEIIQKDYPQARIVAEESSDEYVEEEDVPTWYIDPLDGTTNYARGMPTFSCSVAMVQAGEVQCGAVYDPQLDHLFYAQRGEGSFLNGQRLQVSSCDTLMESILLLDWPRDQSYREQSARFLCKLAPRAGTVRSRGSAALSFCYVAVGWADVYYQFTLHPWDVAAGLLIVEEAGGTVTNLRGQAYDLHGLSWLASNGLLHEDVLAFEPYG